MSYQQSWQQQQMDPKAAATDPNMSAAWAAYYQQYYGQTGQPVATAPGATTNGSATSAGSTATAAASQPSINPQTGQADYSQAWVEYYRSLGMHEQAEAILRQTQAAQAATGQTNGSAATASTTSTSQSNTANQQASASNGTHNGTSSQQQQAWAGGYSGYGGYGN